MLAARRAARSRRPSAPRRSARTGACARRHRRRPRARRRRAARSSRAATRGWARGRSGRPSSRRARRASGRTRRPTGAARAPGAAPSRRISRRRPGAIQANVATSAARKRSESYSEYIASTAPQRVDPPPAPVGGAGQPDHRPERDQEPEVRDHEAAREVRPVHRVRGDRECRARRAARRACRAAADGQVQHGHAGHRRRSSDGQAQPVLVVERAAARGGGRRAEGCSRRPRGGRGTCPRPGADATSQENPSSSESRSPSPASRTRIASRTIAASRILLSLTAPQRRLPRPMEGSKIRVVVAKPGLDGHDRGAKIIARALRDAGMEVIYTGLHQTPEQIAETVIQEDAHAVGLSILSGAHMTLVPRVVDLLKQQGADDVVVTVGGHDPRRGHRRAEASWGFPRCSRPGPPPRRSSTTSAARYALADARVSFRVKHPRYGVGRQASRKCPGPARRGLSQA